MPHGSLYFDDAPNPKLVTTYIYWTKRCLLKRKQRILFEKILIDTKRESLLMMIVVDCLRSLAFTRNPALSDIQALPRRASLVDTLLVVSTEVPLSAIARVRY